RYAYRKAPYFAHYEERLAQILHAPWERLVDLDLAMLDFLRDAFSIRTPLRRSSQMKAEGSRSELLMNLCLEIGAGTTFLGGIGGSRRYLDLEAFHRAGIGVQWQQFEHPAYAQCGDAPFMPGLTSLDFLFNCGPAAAETLWKRTGSHELLAA
ncbi:MAG TPA: WbqC family protein, partial [Usitatibacter sp.]|nr:WbqC family protein [Usitatibacter sp.]